MSVENSPESEAEMQQLFSYYYATFHLLDGSLSWMLASVSSKWAGPYAHRSTHLLDTLPSIPASVPFNRFFVEYMGLAHSLTRLSIIALGRLVKGSEHTYTSRNTRLNQRPTWNYKRETLSSHWSSTPSSILGLYIWLLSKIFVTVLFPNSSPLTAPLWWLAFAAVVTTLFVGLGATIFGFAPRSNLKPIGTIRACFNIWGEKRR